MTVEELILEHRAATSQRAQAKIEARLWAMRPDNAGKHGVYLKNLIGLTDDVSTIEARSRLLGAPDLLWNFIDSPDGALPIRTALDMVKKAEKQKDMLGALQALLLEYKSWPLYRSKKGVAFRRRPATRLSGQSLHSRATKVSEDKNFWHKLRHDIDVFATKRLKHLPENLVENFVRTLERDLNLLLEEWQTKVYYARARGLNAPEQVKISRTKLVNACQIFSLSPPKHGESVDMVLAKKRWRLLASEYHPDKRGEATADQFRAVKEAWQVLQSYDEQLKENGNGVEQHE